MENNRFTVGAGTEDSDFVLEYLREQFGQRGRGITVNAQGIGDGKVSFLVAYFWDIGQDSISYDIGPRRLIDKVLTSVKEWHGFPLSSSITLNMLSKKPVKEQFKIARMPSRTSKSKGLVLGIHGQAKLLEQHDLHCIEIIGVPATLKSDIQKNDRNVYDRIQAIIAQRDSKVARRRTSQGTTSKQPEPT